MTLAMDSYEDLASRVDLHEAVEDAARSAFRAYIEQNDAVIDQLIENGVQQAMKEWLAEHD